MAKLLGNFQEYTCGVTVEKKTIRESRELQHDLFTQVKSESSVVFSFLLQLSYLQAKGLQF